jgi:hypothetical protein
MDLNSKASEKERDRAHQMQLMAYQVAQGDKQIGVGVR